MYKNALSFCISLMVVSLHWGQQMQFNALTVEDGLSQHDVSSILQDSEGFIWIGTYDGLNRFDGYDIKTFIHDNNNQESLSSNRIRSLFEDNQKRIWIGTDGYGLNYYSLYNGNFTRIETPDNYHIINDIAKKSDSVITVATSQGLLKVTDTNNKPFVEIAQTPLTGLNVKKICVLHDKSVLYATNRGIWQYRDNKYKLIENSVDISFNWITETQHGDIWVGGSSGLYELLGKTLIARDDLLNATILSMVEANENDLWISTFDQGLFHLNLNNRTISKIKASNALHQNTLESNSLQYLFKDATNTLWVSNKKGVLYSNLDNKSFKNLPIAKKGHVRTLFATNEHVYYGLQSDQYYLYSLKDKTNKPIVLPNNAKSFRVDTLNGNIHLATTKGLYKEKKPGTGTFELVPVFGDRKKDESIIFTSFRADKYGNQFFGTFVGLIYKNQNNTGWIHEKFKNLESLRNIRIFSLKSDDHLNCLWVGTISKGLFKINFDTSGNIISAENYSEQMTGAYKIPNNSIWCFFQDAKGALYVGTDTGLLVRKPNENQFESILVEDIQNKKIMGIVEDEYGNLWLNNSRGIIRFNPQKNTTQKYNHFDGLVANTFTEAISKNENHQLFFGSISGINYLESAKLQNNLFSSSVAFTNLLVDNSDIQVGEALLGSVILDKTLNNTKKIKLNHKQNDFTIEFTSTNYSNVRTNKYRYKLIGYEKDWRVVDNDKRYASYSNLPSGTYELLVAATNPDGKWSEESKSIIITINPAPWNTWWAYLIYVLCFLSILAAFIYFWFNKQKLRSQIELSNLKSEQEKEINELKLIFFTDVAHEFKTPLSLVIGPLNDLTKGEVSKEHKEFCYNIISRNTSRMMHLVNQLLDFRKVNSGVNILKVSRNDMISFVKEIAKSFEWQAKNSNIKFNIISPESYFCHFDKDIVEKVIYNLLSNAFKYTPKGGQIEIEIKPTWKQELEYFVILIKDSGKGISQLDKKKIFQRHFHGKERSSSGIGLHLAATLIEAHKGEINVLNSALGGTEFMITLPVSSKAFDENEYLTKEDIPKYLPHDYVPGEIVQEIDIENDTNKEKILIVEDDYDLRKYLFNTLSTEYIVLEAANGAEGLQCAEKEIPDIIVSDVMMPEMDGIEMCKKIKKNKSISHIPVLMLTAKTGDEFYNKGLKVGAWDYIAKPFDSSHLVQKIKNIIDTRNNFRDILANGSPTKAKSHYVSYDQKFVKNVREIVLNRISNPAFSVEDLSAELGLSRMQLHRKLKSLIGLNTTAFINTIKIEKAIEMFDNGCDRVQEAMDSVGINSYAHFNSLFKKEKGITPSKYIEQTKKPV
ncbi:two component regulator with propeller domain [Kordia periserrulae]|uniref:histidine kinase n=1 Tax=Kordia periserrulae TaxID=701523 RepID=A0A2T6BUE2_9FLAO|nr:hybrid sensor histidine kinase/response regulator transcription factor [Kordia periserrulae]PTX59700.1 two component regulator with propeller domain [Kordia periserrulae]